MRPGRPPAAAPLSTRRPAGVNPVLAGGGAADRAGWAGRAAWGRGGRGGGGMGGGGAAEAGTCRTQKHTRL